jgi:hypothetical protein
LRNEANKPFIINGRHILCVDFCGTSQLWARRLEQDEEKGKTLLRDALIALVILAAPLPSFFQSCALCYTQAASAGTRMIQALRSGILILIVPPTLMSVGMIFIVYRKRHQFRQAADAADSDRNR